MGITSVSAQIDFLPHYLSDVNYTAGEIGSTTAFDVDGDGDLDLIYCSLYDTKIVWLENLNGVGDFGNIKLIHEGLTEYNALYGADVNSDGSIDIIATSENEDITWFENLGGGLGFGQPEVIADDVNYANAVVAGDMDLDGDMDIVVCSDYEHIVWYENTDGAGSFNSGSFIASNIDGELSVVVADLDGDVDLDIIWTSIEDDEYIHINWIENIGNGESFSSSQTIYNFTPENNYPNHANIAADDMDSDGDLDIIFSANNEIRWLENTNGEGGFNDVHLIVESYYRDKHVKMEAADLDGDGDFDVAATTNNFNDPHHLAWYENIDGLGGFGEEMVVHKNIANTQPLLANDLDGDGKMDLVSGSYGYEALVWFKNRDNSGTFEVPHYITKLVESPSNAMTKDLDGDGDLDVFAVMHGAIVGYENLDGEGGLGLQSVILPMVSGNFDFADFDGDGDDDIVTSGYGEIKWYENENLSFTEAQHIEFNQSNLNRVGTGDVDGDGDMDILLSINVNNGSGLLVWHENTDGQGNFGSQQIITNLGSGFITHFVYVDIDGDMNKDILFSIDDGSSGTVGKVGWLKSVDGNGNFSAVQEIDDEDVNRVLVADIDGDGDRDIVTGTYIKDNISWYEHLDGAGDFGSRQVISETGELNGIQSLSSGDFDNDGDLDLVSASRYGVNLAFYENIDGFGDFGEQVVLTDDIKGANTIAVGDINGDSRLDILLSGSEGNQALMWAENQGLSRNRITGVVRLDLEGNDCMEFNTGMENVRITSNHELSDYSTFTNSNGVFQLYVEHSGTYTTSIAENFPTYFTVAPVEHLSEFDDSGDIATPLFCVSPNKEVTDLNISFFPTNNARPGFRASYILVYENVGTTVMSGDITLAFESDVMELLDADAPIIAQEEGLLTFEYADLLSFETRTIRLSFQLNAPPSVNIGDILTYIATINPISGDNTEEDNVFVLDQVVIGSYDPNDINVLEGESIFITEVEEFLHYIIRFQNTGTAEAINVVVTNELSDLLDGTTFELENMSHEGTVEIKNDEDITFAFLNINLPDSTSNEPASHGYIAYKIKPKSSVDIGDILPNQANIYFDFNPAIITNEVTTEIIDVVGTDKKDSHASIAVYPIPTNGALNINSALNNTKFKVFSVSGEMVLQGIHRSTIDLSELKDGLYFLLIEDQNGVQHINRIVIQR